MPRKGRHDPPTFFSRVLYTDADPRGRVAGCDLALDLVGITLFVRVVHLQVRWP